MSGQHGGRRDNTKRRPDDQRGGVRVPGPGKKLGAPAGSFITKNGITAVKVSEITKLHLQLLAVRRAMREDELIAALVEAARQQELAE
jgi:hypothetical protein